MRPTRAIDVPSRGNDGNLPLWVSRTALVSVGCRNSVGEARSIRLAVEAPGQNPTMEASLGGGRTPRYADVEMQVPGNNYR